jgi:hypothetical protein
LLMLALLWANWVLLSIKCWPLPILLLFGEPVLRRACVRSPKSICLSVCVCVYILFAVMGRERVIKHTCL